MSLCVCLCGPKVFFQCDGEGEGWGNVATAIARCVCCLFPFAPVLFQYWNRSNEVNCICGTCTWMHFKAVALRIFLCFFFMSLLCLLAVAFFVVVFLLYRISEISTISVCIHEAFGVMNCTRVWECVCVCECSYVCIINQIFYIHLCVCLSVICMCFFHSLPLYLRLSRFDVALAFVHLGLRVGHGPWVPRIGFPFN